MEAIGVIIVFAVFIAIIVLDQRQLPEVGEPKKGPEDLDDRYPRMY